MLLVLMIFGRRILHSSKLEFVPGQARCPSPSSDLTHPKSILTYYYKGGSLLKGLDVDVFVTGELSHHEALAAKERGVTVITTLHSNSERAFLSAQMMDKLSQTLLEELRPSDAPDYYLEVDENNIMSVGLGREYDFEVAISQADRDPYDLLTPEG